MGRQNIFTKLWNKIIEPGISQALVGLISLLVFGGIMVFASLRSAPSQLRDHETRIKQTEAKIVRQDSTLIKHDYDIQGLRSQNGDVNKKLDDLTRALEQNRQLSEKILFTLTRRDR